MRKTTPLLVQLDGQSLGDVTVSIDESKITPELANLNKTATTISTTTSSSNTVLGTVANRMTAKNAAQEDKTVAQSAVDACTKLDAMQKTIVDDVVGDLQSADGKTTIFDCASATTLCLVDDPNAPAADQVRVGAAVKRIRDTIGQTTDADTESTTIGLLKKIKTTTATETTTQSLKALVGTADDAAGTNTVIGLLKEIYTKNVPINVITQTFFSIYYNMPNYIYITWTPIEPVNGNYTVNIQLQPKHAILIRREFDNYYVAIQTYFNGTTTATSIAFTVSQPLFVSQQVLYTDGLNYEGSVNYVSKDPIRSISEEYRNGANFSNWLLKFTAKFE